MGKQPRSILHSQSMGVPTVSGQGNAHWVAVLFCMAIVLVPAIPCAAQPEAFFGTTEPFASEAIYFVLTDRFVDGDANNNHVSQGGSHGTWQRRLDGPDGQAAFVGYLGGDFKGVYEHADYIKDMGFTAVWISPIVDNPDQAFTGGSPVHFGAGVGTDGGKTGYHGYWGVNFFQVDEHLESPGFHFAEFAHKLQADHGLKLVLDIVANHGSPSWTMPVDQPKFGEIYDKAGTLIADHQNQPPHALDPAQQPLHRFFNKGGNLAQLSDLNENYPAVLEYLVEAYLQWIDQGADAFRVDTIAWMPHGFWKQFADRIRAVHPGFFMFGENFNFDADVIAQHQKPENGAISVLDFPGKASIVQVFENKDSAFQVIQEYLHLTDCVYTNPYELATFYDNHDMARMNASENGFIDAHNWLFTARGIPVIYYGSESRFQHGKAEHYGNRNYFGPENVAAARSGRIYQGLAKIGSIRKGSLALQKGLQENLVFQGHQAAFYRVYQKDDVTQTALVLLNKGDQTETFTIEQFVSAGTWTDAHTGEAFTVSPAQRVITTAVAPHDVKVLLFNDPLNHSAFLARLRQVMRLREGCQAAKVDVVPDPLLAGDNVTITYRAGFGKQVALHWGINNWHGTATPVSEDPMTFIESEQAHQITFPIPDNATQLDFVFHHLTDNTWDNNQGQDWHFQVLTDEAPANGFQTRFGREAVLRLTGAQFAGWDPANAQYVLKRVADFTWEGTVQVPSTLLETPYKLTLNGDWTVNWGGGGAGTEAQLARGSANATVTLEAGTYVLQVIEGSSIESPVHVRWLSEESG